MTARHLSEAHRKARRASQLRAREWAYQYLLSHPCVDCGENDPVVLQFDHVGDHKRAAVADMVRNGCGADALEAEAAQCEVRCANCHSRVTAAERGTYCFTRHYLGLDEAGVAGV